MLVHGLLAVAGTQLALWAALRRGVLSRPVLPTDLAFWFDRFVTAAALVGGGGVALASLSAIATFSATTLRRSPS